ncbi:MAG: VCBS repeat-containing protein [Planctomycetes bacterium]|nr:VCBS repeat-containing protein [Planctomycetota bacterium]
MRPAASLRSSLLPLLLVALCGGSAAADEQPLGTEHFLDQSLRVGGRIQTVATQDVNDDGLLDLIVIHCGEVRGGLSGRWVSVFLQQRGAGFPGLPDQTFAADPSAAAVAFLRLGWEKGLTLALFRSDGVIYHAWNGERWELLPRRLLFTRTFFQAPQADALPVFRYPIDIDRNGLDELLVPQEDGYRIYFQHQGGKFGRISPIALAGARSVTRGSGNALVANYAIPRLEVEDVNGDWRRDLVTCSGSRFSYWLQDERGAFPSTPSATFDLEFLKASVQRNRVQASFTTLVDVNGDQSADLIVAQTSGDVGVFESLVTKIVLYLGRKGAPFSETPDQILNLKGVSIDPQLVDVNGDGRTDLVVSSFRTDLLGAAKSALLQAVNVSYYIFLFDPKTNRFSDDYDFERMVTIPTDSIEKGGRGLPHIYFSGDFDGDKRNDMVTLSGEGRLAVYRGREGVGLFHSSGLAYEKDEWFLAFPETPKGVEIRDFDKNGRADLLLKYGSRIRVLLSR